MSGIKWFVEISPFRQQCALESAIVCLIRSLCPHLSSIRYETSKGDIAALQVVAYKVEIKNYR